MEGCRAIDGVSPVPERSFYLRMSWCTSRNLFEVAWRPASGSRHQCFDSLVDTEARCLCAGLEFLETREPLTDDLLGDDEVVVQVGRPAIVDIDPSASSKGSARRLKIFGTRMIPWL